VSTCYELTKAVPVVQVLRLWANLLSCSTCSRSEQSEHNARRARGASNLSIMLDMLDERATWAWCSTCSTSEQGEQISISLVYRNQDTTLLWIVFNLSIKLPPIIDTSCNPLLPSDCLHCLKTSTDLSNSTNLPWYSSRLDSSVTRRLLS